MDEYMQGMSPLDQGRKSVAYTKKKLIAGQLLGRSDTKEELLTSAAKLSKLLKTDADKMDACIMATTGEHICKVTKTDTSESPITRLVVVMASFNQATEIQQEERNFVIPATICRFISDYKSCTFSSSNTCKLPSAMSTLASFAQWLRLEEMEKKQCQEGGIVVLLLVDEVMKLAPHGEDKRILLDALASFQHQELRKGLLSLVLVTSLNVGALDSLTQLSKRPVFSLPLAPLEEEGLEKCRSALYVKANVTEGGEDLKFTKQSNIEYALAATGGHLARLEEVSTVGCESMIRKIHCSSLRKPIWKSPNCSIQRLRILLGDSDQTIRSMANLGMIVYEEVDMLQHRVRVRLIPAALDSHNSCHMNPDGMQKEATLIAGILQRATQAAGLEKLWERAIPMAQEFKGRAFLKYDQEPDICSLLPCAKVVVCMGLSVAACLASIGVEKKNFEPIEGQEAIPRFVVATNPNQPAIELFTDIFEAVMSDGNCKPVRCVCQMKMWKSITAGNLQGWIDATRRMAQTPKGTEPAYVVLCVSKNISDPPKGAIYITAEDCSSLLAPFGASPMKRLIEEKAIAGNNG
eukprot:1589161-Amphidinium_carterae.1